jgi:hypothetical protein
MCEFTRKGFVDGMVKLEVDSIESLQAKLPALRNQLKDDASLKEIYTYAFKFGKEPQARSLGTARVGLTTQFASWNAVLKMLLAMILLFPL